MSDTLPPMIEIWVYLSGSPLLALVLTLSAYLLGLSIYEKSQRHPLTNPVLIAVIVVAIAITALNMPYTKYFEGAQFVHFLLGTATVSLAIPIYKGFESLRSRVGVLLLALIAGGVTSIATAVGVVKIMHIDEALVRGLWAKSVTAPIAIGVAERIHASPTLTAIFAVSSGILGAV
ncbi:MAG: LrgB family protein, partial [Limnohabitans sp.]|nr:LrgB family protein [Limnohabitans sp.]